MNSAEPVDFELALQRPGLLDLALRLMPERTVFHAPSRTLLVADLHLGKAAVFRARGLPVPQGTTTATLARLSQALLRCGAQRLVVLGDLMHAKESHAPATLEAIRTWRMLHAELTCCAVQGNHDLHAGGLPADLAFENVDSYSQHGWDGVHDAAQWMSQPGWLLSGHVHPVLRLRSSYDTVRIPCFWLSDRVLTLPAFGEFTGGWVVGHRAGASERFFAVSKRVTEIRISRCIS